MSKTIRRKNAIYLGSFTEWGHLDGMLINVPLEGKELKKSKAKFHSKVDKADAATGSVPAYFRRAINSKRRATDKQKLNKAMASGDFDAFFLNNWKKDAGYEYW